LYSIHRTDLFYCRLVYGQNYKIWGLTCIDLPNATFYTIGKCFYAFDHEKENSLDFGGWILGVINYWSHCFFIHSNGKFKRKVLLLRIAEYTEMWKWHNHFVLRWIHLAVLCFYLTISSLLNLFSVPKVNSNFGWHLLKIW